MQVDSRSVVPQAPAILQSAKIENENIIPNQNNDVRVAGVRSIWAQLACTDSTLLKGLTIYKNLKIKWYYHS